MCESASIYSLSAHDVSVLSEVPLWLPFQWVLAIQIIKLDSPTLLVLITSPASSTVLCFLQTCLCYTVKPWFSGIPWVPHHQGHHLVVILEGCWLKWTVGEHLAQMYFWSSWYLKHFVQLQDQVLSSFSVSEANKQKYWVRFFLFFFKLVLLW